MIKILITGSNSYVGTNVEKWLMKKPDKYYIESLDLKNSNWKDFSFSRFNVVFHVAAIAHKKEKKRNKRLYYKINRDLALEVAIKSKESNVEHFIFMSSMSIFGLIKGVITNVTVPKPTNMYGHSKLEAEKLISNLINAQFNVTILRPPMIYGMESPGNFKKMKKLAKYMFLFPNTKNQRSMLFIDNLSIILDDVITNKLTGYIYPENKERVNTFDAIRLIRVVQGKKTINSYILLPLIKIIEIFSKNFKKIFSSLYYEMDKRYETKNLYSLEESIKKSVKNHE